MKGKQMNLNEIFSKDNSIYETWRLCNAEHADLPAIEYFGNQWTFKETDDMIDIYTRAFMAMLPDRTKSVTFCVPTLPATLFAFYALNKIGVRANFVSHTVLPSDPQEYLDETDTEILVLLDGFFPAVAAEIVKTNLEKIIIISLSDDITTVPDYVLEQIRPLLQKSDSIPKIKSAMPQMDIISLDEFIAIGKQSKEEVKSVYNKGDTAVVLYTGGSTGVPKGVEILDKAAIDISIAYHEILNMDPGFRNLILIPPNHPTSFMVSMIMTWFCGAVQILQPIYNKNTFANDLKNYKAEFVIAAPSHYMTLIKSNMKPNDLSYLRYAGCGGEPVSYEMVCSINDTLKMAGAINPWLALGYGMSELGPTAMSQTAFDISNGLKNKVGKPLPNVSARIVDDNGNILGDNIKGNLEIRTPYRMKGYFKRPELTAEFFTKDGFAITGDIAIRDEKGYYDILGRSKDFIITSDGAKAYLFDIERVVYKDPAVLECEVIGLTVGNVKLPIVHIVLNAECLGKNKETIFRIHKLCQKHLTEYEIPKAYKIRDAFGTNPISAKRDYKALELERDGYFAVEDGEVKEVSF
jgi:long-chain acyl-CoA synthetase